MKGSVRQRSRKQRAVEAEGATTKEAIELAISTLGVSQDQVTVEVLSEEHRGLFGMKGAKPAKVRVTVKDGSVPV